MAIGPSVHPRCLGRADRVLRACGQRRMWTVTLMIVPPATTVPPNHATAGICAVCPRAARRQIATIASNAVMAEAAWLTWAERDVISLGVPFRGVGSGFISRDFARADVIPTRRRGVLGRTLRRPKLGCVLRGSPFAYRGPRWSNGECASWFGPPPPAKRSTMSNCLIETAVDDGSFAAHPAPTYDGKANPAPAGVVRTPLGVTRSDTAMPTEGP